MSAGDTAIGGAAPAAGSGRPPGGICTRKDAGGARADV